MPGPIYSAGGPTRSSLPLRVRLGLPMKGGAADSQTGRAAAPPTTARAIAAARSLTVQVDRNTKNTEAFKRGRILMKTIAPSASSSKGQICRFCGHPLRATESTDRGIGPVCLKKHQPFLAKERAVGAAGQLDLFQPQYSIRVLRGKVVLYDRDSGRRSLTSAIDEVVPHLYRRGILTAKRALVYKDSEGVFDGVAHAGGQFMGFFPLGAKTMARAIKKLAQRSRSKIGVVS